MTGPSKEDMSLLVSLMSASHSMTTGVMDSLVMNLTYAGRRDEARLSLVQTAVSDALSGPYMPMPNTIMSALYPSPTEVEAWLQQHYGPDWRDPATPKLRGCCDCC